MEEFEKAGAVEGIWKPAISVTATIHQELPEQVIEVLRKNNLKLKLDKTILGNLVNQLPGMIARDGCISSPSGPGC